MSTNTLTPPVKNGPIAALLIPLHHRIEHWIKHRMVEKNKKIKLEAAKKTIKHLEGNTD